MNPVHHFYVVKMPGTLQVCKATCPLDISCAVSEFRLSTPGLTVRTSAL